ncbi:subtilisin-like serine protease [Ceratobasidium sp. 423]|nr:subtilisin-like serine protease [Ceratobasidium sp. 423]
MRTAFLVSALALIIPALSAPTIIPIVERDGPVKPDSYIIKFKDDDSRSSALAQLAQKLQDSGSSMTYDYSPLFNGVAATLKPDVLDFVRKMSEVEYIQQDSIFSLVNYVPADAFDYAPHVAEGHGSLVGRTDGTPNGQGVTVYGIDTGINTAHECFGGRAEWGKTFGDYADADGNGHGTHTAGTAVGNGYGFATGAKIIAVKVLSDKGSGPLSDIMAGVQFAHNDTKTRGGPAVITMSLGALDGPKAQPLKESVQKAIKDGIHFTVAAGNNNTLANLVTPANVEAANTVGALNTTDHKAEKASFSNWGNLIDVWAPGVNIKSAWIGGSKAENIMSGTSMATPFVAGILASVLSQYPELKPAALTEQLKNYAAKNVTFTDTDKVAGELTNNIMFAQLWDCTSQ